MLKKLPTTHTHPLILIHEFSKPYKLLFFELESLIKCLNVNWEKIYSILSVTCHGLRNSLTHTHPLKTIHEFLKPYKLLFSDVRVTRKMLNMNWEKIHSIILSVTCHGLRNFPLLIHILVSICEFSKPCELLYFELRVTHKMLNVNWGKIY